jgi:hypothetical protein
LVKIVFPALTVSMALGLLLWFVPERSMDYSCTCSHMHNFMSFKKAHNIIQTFLKFEAWVGHWVAHGWISLKSCNDKENVIEISTHHKLAMSFNFQGLSSPVTQEQVP